MASARLDMAQRWLEALQASADDARAALLTVLHPKAQFAILGKNASGADAVVNELLQGVAADAARKLQWQAPVTVGDTVRLTGERRQGMRDRGLVVTLSFEGDAISAVQLQRTPPPPPDATPIVLPDALKTMIDRALVERHPMLVAHCGADGQPVMSYRGSIQAYGDDRLAMWIRSAEGGFIQAIRHNPRIALVYRNEETKATYHFHGRARESEQAEDRQHVFDAMAEAERAHDFAKLGRVVIVDLDRVEGYAGLGPNGQVGQIRMLRAAAQ